MAETMTFFQDKKKVTYTLVGLCAAALFFVLVCPTLKISAALLGQSASESISLFKYMDEKAFAGLMLILLPIAAGALTWFKADKNSRWIAGGLMALGFLIYVITMPTSNDIAGLEQIFGGGFKFSIGMGVGVILYLLFTIAYFVVNFLSKE